MLYTDIGDLSKSHRRPLGIVLRSFTKFMTFSQMPVSFARAGHDWSTQEEKHVRLSQHSRFCTGKTHSNTCIGSTGHGGGTRSGQTRMKEKDMSAWDREERGRGEGGGVCCVHAISESVTWIGAGELDSAKEKRKSL